MKKRPPDDTSRQFLLAIHQVTNCIYGDLAVEAIEVLRKKLDDCPDIKLIYRVYRSDDFGIASLSPID
jgi:hypothetical protein